MTILSRIRLYDNIDCMKKCLTEEVNSVRITELEKRMHLHSEAAQAAVTLAANDLRARLDAMNEFRAALRDQSSTFVPRNELENKFENIYKELKDLESSRLILEGKASQRHMNLTITLAILAAIASLISILLNYFK